MFSYKNILKFFLSFLIITGSMSLTSCKDDDPVSAQEEHFEAIGIHFSSSGIELGKILRGVTTDTLFAPLGSLSDHIEVKFYDEDENLVNAPDDEDETFGWQIDDATIAEVFQDTGEEGSFEFHLRGLKAGSTKIEFFIVHEGHNDFRSGKITVTVR